METIYTIGYVAADVDYNELGKGDILESHRNLERAKERLLEILHEHYRDTIQEEGEEFIQDNLSPDGLEFVVDECDYFQKYFIEENQLDD